MSERGKGTTSLKGLAAFVGVWMVLIVLANTFLFAGSRSSAEIMISNIGILIALWVAFRLARRSGSAKR
jgi:spore maturation protein SpmA